MSLESKLKGGTGTDWKKIVVLSTLKEYPATEDGLKDALSDVTTNDTVVIPVGNINCSAPQSGTKKVALGPTNDYICIMGHGRSSRITNTNTAGQHLLVIAGTSGGTAYDLVRVEVRNLSLIGVTGSGNGLNVTNTLSFLTEGLYIASHGGVGLRIDDGNDPTIAYCYFASNGSHGLHATDCHELNCINCQSFENGGSGYHVTSTGDGGMENHFSCCTSEDNNNYGFVFDNGGGAGGLMNCTIVGGSSDMEQQAIYIEDSSYISVHGFTTWSSRISMKNAKHCVIKGCTLYTAGASNIYLQSGCEWNIIEGNSIIAGNGDTTRGIAISDSSYNVIANNNIEGGTGNSCLELLGNSDRNKVHHNFCRNSGAYGINISASTCDKNELLYNTCLGNSTGQINDIGTDTVKTGNTET